MPNYKVTRLIKAAVRLGAPCEVDGIELQPLEPFQAGQVLVSQSIEADRWREASKLFDEHLLTVADAMSIVMGVALVPSGASTLVEKTRSKYIFLNAMNKRSAAAMTVVPEYFEGILGWAADAAVRFTSDSGRRNAAHYLRQAAVTEVLTTGAFHSLQAAEALCQKGVRTSHRGLRSLMGDELYDYFYGNDPVLAGNRRNSLAHGRMIGETGLGDKVTALQMRLLGRVRQSIGVPSNLTMTFTPIRGFVTFESHPLFLEPLTQPVDFPALIESATKGQLHSASNPRWVGNEVTHRLWRRW